MSGINLCFLGWCSGGECIIWRNIGDCQWGCWVLSQLPFCYIQTFHLHIAVFSFLFICSCQMLRLLSFILIKQMVIWVKANGYIRHQIMIWICCVCLRLWTVLMLLHGDSAAVFFIFFGWTRDSARSSNLYYCWHISIPPSPIHGIIFFFLFF